MNPAVLLVALLLWPWSAPAWAFPSVTVSPAEEKNLNHYVQVLESLILSVPTREPDLEKKSKPPKNVYSTGSKVSRFRGLITSEEALAENDVLTSPDSKETTTFPPRDFTQGMKRKTTRTTAFWSIKPNNISVVLHSEEPYIEKEEEPEPTEEHAEAQAPEPPPSAPASAGPPTAGPATSPDSTAEAEEEEDVPQLSGEPAEGAFQEPEFAQYNDILRKISEIQSEVRQAPLGDSNNPEYKDDIKASEKHLKQSLALAAAAEHKLEKMYSSQLSPPGRSSGMFDNSRSVINILYNSRSKLSEYLDIKYVPPEMKGKAAVVLKTLKKILCVGQEETRNLIGKLLGNNIKIKNQLEIP